MMFYFNGKTVGTIEYSLQNRRKYNCSIIQQSILFFRIFSEYIL